NPEDKLLDKYTENENFKIIFHEFTHYLDHISTLWGQKNLIKVFNALNAMHESNENNFWYVVELYKDIKKFKYSKYYRVINPYGVTNYKSLWKYQLSAGLRFDHTGKPNNQSPVLFTRFYTQDNILMCRVPFSVESLLEANAMTSEIQLQASFIHELDANERYIEQKLFLDKAMKWLYDPELSTYSAATHFAANCCGIEDITDSYVLSSQISSVCLNMPDKFFDILAVPKSFESFGEKNSHFIKNRDIGFLYACIFQNIQDRGIKINAKTFDLNKALEMSNLPSVDEIEKAVAVEFDTIKNCILDGRLVDDLQVKLDIGKKVFLKRGVRFFKYNYIDYLKDGYIPAIIFADDYDNNFLCKRYEVLSKIESKMDEFFEACGY
ncbi:MAG TPA: hypothetical protein VF941_21815, partial [Clostridia bacterium]